MSRRDVRSQRGFSMLELAVSATLVLVFTGVLLERLLFYQEVAEKARMELELTTLELALQVRVGTRIVEHQPIDYAAMARENPVTWLDVPLAGYRGEPGSEEANLLPGGSWYFDRQRLELVYLARQNRHLEPDSSGRRRVRFRLQVLRAQAEPRQDDAAMIGLRLVPVEPYRWF